jgi:hypothetical protein
VKFWIVGAALFVVGQFIYYIMATPERTPRPIAPSYFEKSAASALCVIAYILSVLRLPFAVAPYGLKLFGALVLKKYYPVSQYLLVVEAFRILGEIINWGLGSIILGELGKRTPILGVPIFACIFAETVRLFSEKGQMIFSACWQFLPHRGIAHGLQAKFTKATSKHAHPTWLHRYCIYYALADEDRIAYILSSLRHYAAVNAETSTKLAYLSTLKIVSSSYGMRGGHVRDVARGEVFIHRQWTADPWLLIGQALRRTPWLFDPRYLWRPFYYRTESNRLATMFVLSHFRYSPTYALYQFGHEIKAARYDFFYRILRRLKLDIEPKVQADGTFPFDQGVAWLRSAIFGIQIPDQAPLWQDQAVIEEVKRRMEQGETFTPLDIAIEFTYPLKYVSEVLMDRING